MEQQHPISQNSSCYDQENQKQLVDNGKQSGQDLVQNLKNLTLLNGKQNEEEKSTEKITNKHENESVLMDFSNTFKQNTRAFKSKKSRITQNNKPLVQETGLPIEDKAKDESNNPNKDLEDQNMIIQPDNISFVQEIPRNLEITQEDMKERKWMDMRRWFCIARPQHPKSCGISSLTSVWNYLYSTLGVGQHRPISTEEALEVLGFKPPYTNVDFGSFTGNDTLIQWFGLLNKFFKVKGQAKIAWKVHGKTQTHGIDKHQALDNLITGLKSETKAYIYHCWNHYFCPIGYERTPTQPFDAYSKTENICEFDAWIIIGEVSKCYPVFHVKKWEDIATDINCAFPQFFNIRKSELGIQEKISKAFTEGSKVGGNLHCIIEFESLTNLE